MSTQMWDDFRKLKPVYQRALLELRSFQVKLTLKDKTERLRRLRETRDAIVDPAAQPVTSELTKPLTFPPEILRLIFPTVVDFDEGPTSKSPYPMVIVLASVCRTWRLVVLDDPKLWCHIDLDHYLRYNHHRYLSLSAGLPLDINLSDPYVARLSSTFSYPFLKEAHRWRSLRVDLADISIASVRPLLNQKRAQSLTYLHMVNHRPQYDQVCPVFAARQEHLQTLILIRTPMPKVLVAPRLEDFVFASGVESLDRPKLRLSYHHLRPFLLSARNLRTLGLGVMSISFGRQVAPIVLPHLHQLTLYFDAKYQGDPEDRVCPHLCKILDMISAPILRGISLISEDGLVFYDDSMQDIYLPFWNLEGPRYPTVTTAILHCSICFRHEALQFISAFPHITNLITDDEALPHLFSAFQGGEFRYTPETQWEFLDYIRVEPIREARNPDVKNLKALCGWLALRQEQVLSRISLEVLMDERAMETGLRAEYRKWLGRLGKQSLSLVVKASSGREDPWKYHVIPQRSKSVTVR